MYNYLTCGLLILALSSCKGKTDNNEINIVLHNDNHIPDRQANEYFDKGIQCVEQNDLGQARTYFLKADRQCPNIPVILTAIGNCYTGMHSPESGVPYFEKALKADSSFVKTYVNFGNCLNSMNDFEKAIDILNLGLSHRTTYQIDRHGLFLNLAIAYYCLHNKEKASQMLDSITSDTHHDQFYQKAVQLRKSIDTP